LIVYRPFRNTDPPGLAEIWRTQAPERGLAQPMSAALIEAHLLAKPYFERQALIVAEQGSELVGFAHAAFGPNAAGTDIDTHLGVTCLVMVRASHQRQGIGAQLLEHSERYLCRHGARTLLAGGISPNHAFYLGLYGGSGLPGVLASAPRAEKLFRSHGYRELRQICVLHRDLAGFRPVFDRTHVQIRRRTLLQVEDDPPPATWWEACTEASFDRTRFTLQSRDAQTPMATATFWDIQPLSQSWGVLTAGLSHLHVAPPLRRQGLGSYLLGEALHALARQGFAMVEAQLPADQPGLMSLFHRLGFVQVDVGYVLQKDV